MMPVPVYLPKFDPQHEESKILDWMVSESDSVVEGEPLCEVETDKVNMEVEAPSDGTLAAVRFAKGDVAPAAQIIAFILLEGESLADIPLEPTIDDQTQVLVDQPATGSPSVPDISPVAERVARSQNIDLQTIVGSGPRGRILKRDVETHSVTGKEQVRATPAARHLARLNNLNLDELDGSGPKGRIQAADVQIVLMQQPMNMPYSTTKDDLQTYPLEGMRQRIANRVQHSYQTAPHIFVEMPVDMTQIVALRQARTTEGESLSVTAVLVKVCAWALTRHPQLNATLVDDTITLNSAVNPGIAVALDDGLIVPVIHHADQQTLAEIQARSSDLIARARNGRLQPGDVANGTFTISNLGMFGVSRFTAIINPPQVAILAVGRITRQFVPDENDQPVVRPLMNMVLAVDHRVIDGADAARFLDDLRKALEQPLRLL